MFDQDFYPTPRAVIEKMLSPFMYKGRLNDKLTILEPSAGKGDILDFIKEASEVDSKYYRNNTKLVAVEKHPELRMILEGKGYKVDGTDFLEYTPSLYFNLIVQNPPFSDGCKHLLHSWNILKKGDIVCLLNQETIDNPFSQERKLLKGIIELNGSVEYLGDCFSEAERKTGVNVIMVRLHKEEKTSDFDFFKGNDFETTNEKFIDGTGMEESPESMLEKPDVIKNKVRQFHKAKEAYIEFIQAKRKMEYYANGISSGEFGRIVSDSHSKGTYEEGFNYFAEEFSKNAWNHLFTSLNLKKMMTEGVKKDFDKFCTEQGSLAYNEENIHRFVDSLFLNRKAILSQAVIDVFDKMTSYDMKNKIHVEGWKTNDAWKVNRKVIVPWCIEMSDYGMGKRYSLRCQSSYFLGDVDKVMCLLTGKKLEDILTIENALRNQFKLDPSAKTCESEFFELRYFDKGTLHFIFKDEALLDKFNIESARGKNWLPDVYDKKGV